MMPDVGADGGEGVQAASWWRHTDRVQVASGVTSEDHLPGEPILDRKTKVVKLNINRIIATESFNRNEIFDERGGNEDMAKVDGGRGGGQGKVAGVRDRQRGAVANNDARMRGGEIR